jgi:hypothetical protein
MPMTVQRTNTTNDTVCVPAAPYRHGNPVPFVVLYCKAVLQKQVSIVAPTVAVEYLSALFRYRGGLLLRRAQCERGRGGRHL